MNRIRRVMLHCQQRARGHGRRNLAKSSVLGPEGGKYSMCQVSGDKNISGILNDISAKTNLLSSCLCSANRYMKCQVSPDKSSSVIHLPGIPLGEMDATGNIAPWHMLRIGESARLLSYGIFGSNCDLFHWRSMLSDRLMFIVSNSVYLQPRLVSPNVPYHQPIEYSIKILEAGNSSCTHLEEMKLAETGDILSNAVVKFVAVDKETRRPKMLPDSIKEAFKVNYHTAPSHIDPHKRISAMLPPVTSYVYRSKVEYCDHDIYGHTNHSSYMRFVFNALYAARKGNYLSPIIRDISFQNLKEMHLLYQGETTAGDDITTYVWQEPSEPYTVNAVVQKQDKPVFTSVLVFKS